MKRIGYLLVAIAGVHACPATPGPLPPEVSRDTNQVKRVVGPGTLITTRSSANPVRTTNTVEWAVEPPTNQVANIVPPDPTNQLVWASLRSRPAPEVPPMARFSVAVPTTTNLTEGVWETNRIHVYVEAVDESRFYRLGVGQ